MYALEIENISKEFRLNKKNILFDRTPDKVAAIRDLSLKVKKGECIGIIGRNGSGKTTLLRLVAGIIKPDKGKINIKGKLMSFIDLNAGVNPELTGKENIFLYASLLGMANNEIKREYNNIVDYAQIPKKFLNTKFKNYSSGMKARLTFSIAMANDPDVILIDETISVGDESFQKKSFGRIKELMKSGKTILIVSHNISQLVTICDLMVLLEEGKLIKKGHPMEVMNHYLSDIYDKDMNILIESIKNKKVEIKKLKKETGEISIKKSFFGGNKTSKNKNKIDELKSDLLDQVNQIINILAEKNFSLLNMESYHIENKDLKTLNNLKKLIMDNYFKILEFIVLKIQYSYKNTVDTKTLQLYEKVLIGLFGAVSSNDDIKKTVEYFTKIYSVADSSEDLGFKKRLILEFRHFVKEKVLTVNDKKLENYLERTADRFLEDRNYNENLSIQEQEGFLRKKFDESTGEKERQKLIYSFFSLCSDYMKNIKDRKQKYMFFKNTFLSIMHTLVSQIDDIPFKIGFVKDVKKLFDNEISNSSYMDEDRKIVDILGSFLRNELMKLEDLYLDLNLKLNESGNNSSESEFLKKSEDIKKIRSMLTKSITDLYKRDSDHKKTSWGFGDVIIKKVELFNSKDEKTSIFKTNERFLVRINFLARKKVKNPEFGIAIHKENGVYVCNDSFAYGPNESNLFGEGHLDFIIESLPLKSGRFLISASVYDSIMNIPHDHHFKAYPFAINGNEKGTQEGSLIDIKGKWRTK